MQKHSHTPSLRLFACLSPQTCLNLCCLFSSCLILCHTIYSSDPITLHAKSRIVFTKIATAQQTVRFHLYQIISHIRIKYGINNYRTNSEVLIRIRYIASTPTVSRVTVKPLHYLHSHTGAVYGLRQLEQVVVLLMYCGFE